MAPDDDHIKDPIGGTPANRVAIPIIIAIIALHVLVIFLFFSISQQSRELSAIMQRTGVYTSEATDLLAGSSTLSETATSFILMPVTEGGEINYSPLSAYAKELKHDRRGPQVAKRFESYEVSDENRAYIQEAADAAAAMMDSQLHALALMNSVYPFADTPALESIPLPELSEKEQQYAAEKKVATARQLVLGTEYALNKQTVANDVATCNTNLKNDSSKQVTVTNAAVSQLRNALWVVTFAIIALLGFTFAIIYQQILIPMDHITRHIRSNESTGLVRGLREVREMAIAYNALLHRRDTLEAILRSAAETDALTNLPNRFAFRQYLTDLQDEGCAIGLLVFDVNYLKLTNDNQGHQAGDELLQQSAECISLCFGEPDENNCFRVGGDEFAVVVKNPSAAELDSKIQLFVLEQKRRNLSISWGYALSSETAVSSPEELIAAADKRMYEQKKAMHADALRLGRL